MKELLLVIIPGIFTFALFVIGFWVKFWVNKIDRVMSRNQDDVRDIERRVDVLSENKNSMISHIQRLEADFSRLKDDIKEYNKELKYDINILSRQVHDEISRILTIAPALEAGIPLKDVLGHGNSYKKRSR